MTTSSVTNIQLLHNLHNTSQVARVDIQADIQTQNTQAENTLDNIQQS